ncbi:MAG: NAD(P)-dependent alcohol dehydrogenase [Burkholderiales bacterium]|nr:NAD(P)-dependent alcohol dehydrogenase [Burkholderiales bacterium]
MQAHAAVMHERHGRWSMQTLEVAEPGPEEVLVRVVASGICQTDVHARDGFSPIPLPAVFGHEGAGIVERVGVAVGSLAPGDHVIMANPSCGKCADCRAGFETYCTDAAALKHSGYRAGCASLAFSHGNAPVYGSFFQQSSFASLTLAMARNTIKVPREAPLDVLAAFPCGVNTGAGAVLNVLKPQPGDSYVAFGVGTVGFAGLLAAKLSGCDPIIAVDLFESRLALAQSLGATHAVHAEHPELAAEVRRLAGGRGARFCLEAAGFPQALRNAVESLAPRGTACLVGSARAGVEVSLEMRSLQQGRVVRGCVQGESDVQRFLPRLIELYRAGELPVDRLVRHYPHAAINDAVDDMVAGKTIKAVLRVGAQ